MMDNNNKSNRYFTITATLFVAALLISNIAAQKLIPIGPFIFTGGVLLFPLTFIFNDILTEVWSYKRTRIIVWTGFAASIFMSGYLYLIVKLPPAPGWPFQKEFETTFSLVPRIVLGSLLAYLCGEFMNSFVLSKLKLKDRQKRMGVRFVVSTMVGEAIDTVIFASVALYGIIPNNILITTMWSGFLFKVVYEIAAMPISIPLTKWIKNKSGSDLYDNDTNYNPFTIQ